MTRILESLVSVYIYIYIYISRLLVNRNIININRKDSNET